MSVKRLAQNSFNHLDIKINAGRRVEQRQIDLDHHLLGPAGDSHVVGLDDGVLEVAGGPVFDGVARRHSFQVFQILNLDDMYN